jgi:hypothetical protein
VSVLIEGGHSDVNFAELHLLEHHKKFLEYLQFFQLRPDSPLTPLRLEVFADPTEKRGTKNSISDEIITEIFTAYGSQTRKAESEWYLRTLTGE